MLPLLCTYVSDTYVLIATETYNFDYIVDKIRKKWSSLEGVAFKLYYRLPDCSRCLLSSDEDVVSLFVVGRSCPGVGVHVDVVVDCLVPGSSASSCVSRVVGSHSSRSTVCDASVVPYVDASCTSLTATQRKSRLDLGWGNISFQEGTVFSGGAADFRLSLQKLSVYTGFDYVLKKNDSTRILAFCRYKDEYNCNWMVYGVKSPVTNSFYVKQSCTVHMCGSAGISFDGSRMSSDLVSEVIEALVRDRPTLSAGVLRRDLFSIFKIRVTYFKATLGVWKAKSALFGDVYASFRRLPLYMKCLKDSNPGSRVEYEVFPGTSRFRRLFIAFAGCITGFNSCRPLLFMDAGHLKGLYKGHLLGATGLDGNQGLYPLCFAVVDSESIENWEWFMRHLKEILNPDRPLTFITDRHPGLVQGVPLVFPDSYHSYCLYHLKLNLREKCALFTKSKVFRDRMVLLLDRCAYASTESVFQEHYDLMLSEGGEAVKEFFKNLNHENWTNLHFKGCRYGYVASSPAESFNNWVSPERHLPPMHMAEAIRVKVMKQISARRVYGAKIKKPICPVIDRILATSKSRAKDWDVFSSTRFVCEVKSSPNASVNLFEHTCSCSEWQRYGYPCDHGVAAVMCAKGDLHDFVNVCYLPSSFRACYESAVYPVLDTYLTDSTDGIDVVYPAFSKRPPGRPHSKRYISRGESSKQGQRRAYKCSRCGAGRHNKRRCVAAVQLD